MSLTVLPSKQRRRAPGASGGAAFPSPCAPVTRSVSRDFISHATQNLGMELDPFTQAIIESAPISMIATDTSGMIVAMNSAAERLTCYRKRDIVGQHSLVLLHDPVEMSRHAAEVSQDLKEPVCAGFSSLSARAQRSGSEEREWTYLRKDGSRLQVNLTITPLRSPEGVTGGYLAMAFDITERKKVMDLLAHMAQHDQLTGLPNRSLLDERLAQAIARSKRFRRTVAIYLINIDNFKRFNSSLGNAGGDTLLKYVAAQLKASMRQTDTIARIAGDEFVVVMPDFGSIADAERCKDLMQRNISIPLMVGDREICVTASIGFCLYPNDAGDAAEMLRNANSSMREAKRAGRASLVASSHTTRDEACRRLEMEEDLRHALENGEFALHYQPQIDCATGGVTGLEALLRWNNPKRGNVPPNDFIPLAEEIGLMVPISEWVFRRSCSDCVELQKQTGRSLMLAVNLSPRQFDQRSLPALVEGTLQQSGLAAGSLELEITEQMLMVNSNNTLDALQKIRALGVGIAIDDFGTGFSSFSYILQYQVDRIKIDRSFIAKVLHDSNATAVVRAIIAMAHGLNITVVAEGVETLQQYEFLLRRRCDVSQGYLFSRAVPKDEFAAAVERIDSMRAVIFPPEAGGQFSGALPVPEERREAYLSQ